MNVKDFPDVGTFPFFTAQDQSLIRGESTRDPLGLMPIWSKIGHQLVPGLATIVSRIDGVQGILFIYASLIAVDPAIRSKQADGRILNFLERLWEFHLYQVNGNPCFGINKLNGVGTSLVFDGNGTVDKGLRQYYRGTCNNKGILANDLKTLRVLWQKVCSDLLPKDYVKWLNVQAKQCLKEKSEFSLDATEEYEKIQDSLKHFHGGNDELWVLMENALLTDAQQNIWIDYVLAKYPKWNGDSASTQEIVQLLVNEYSSEHSGHREWATMSQNILVCEPFLQCMESCFAIMQEKGRQPLDELVEELRQNSPKDLALVCERFQAINLSGSFKRLETLQKVAALFQKNMFPEAIRSLQAYYLLVCENRGKPPLVQIDGEQLIVATPTLEKLDWSRSTQTWRNGYFIKAQISLYVDLKERQGIIYG